jgi:hypothetical protein
MDYPLLSINAGIIGAVFIFFSIALLASDFSIFNLESNVCTYGFHLEPSESQVAITVAVGIILVPFAVSSLLVLLRNDTANFITSLGFALIVASAIMIIASLSCMIPYDFFSAMMIVPALLTIGITSLLFKLKKTNFRLSRNKLASN